VLALLVGFVLLLLLPHPWNGAGFAAAMTWEIVAILYCLWWSQRQVPQVGPRLQGETWRARSEGAVGPGAVVRVRSADGLTLHVEPDQPRQPESCTA
jgi:hypothetical protein